MLLSKHEFNLRHGKGLKTGLSSPAYIAITDRASTGQKMLVESSAVWLGHSAYKVLLRHSKNEFLDRFPRMISGGECRVYDHRLQGLYRSKTA